MKVIFSAMFVFMLSYPLLAQNAIGEHPCAADVLKLCKGKSNNKGNIVKCLKENEQKLSTECLTKVTHAKLNAKVKVGSIRKICKEDIIKNCNTKEKGKKRSHVEIVACLSKNKDKLAPRCGKIFNK